MKNINQQPAKKEWLTPTLNEESIEGETKMHSLGGGNDGDCHTYGPLCP